MPGHDGQEIVLGGHRHDLHTGDCIRRDVGMRQHGAFGIPCGSRRVHQDGQGRRIDFRTRQRRLAQNQSVEEVNAFVFYTIHGHDERFPGQLIAERKDVVGLFSGENDALDFGFTKDAFDLALLKLRVQGNNDGPATKDRKERGCPCGPWFGN